MPDAPLHIPVFLDRTIELLAPALDRPGAVLVDATLGLGGHAEAFLRRFPDLQYIGLDRDREALALSAERLAPFADRIQLVHSVYDRIGEVLEELSIRGIAGVLFDLGVSSMQLDRVERGFSYSKDAPLDMRMDDTAPLTAAACSPSTTRPSCGGSSTSTARRSSRPRYARRIVERRRSDAAHHLGPARRAHRRGDAGRRAARRAPGEAGLPGAPHRGQPGAGVARARDAGGARRARGRRTHRGARVPVARGPHRQARARRAIHVDGPRGLPVELPQHAPRVQAPGARCRARERRRACREPAVHARCACAPPRSLGGSMTAATHGNLASRAAAPSPAPPRRSRAATSRSRPPRPASRPAPPRHAVVTIAGIGVILLVQLLLSFVLPTGRTRSPRLQTDSASCCARSRRSRALELLGSTQNLTANAEALGMVASGNPVFLDVATGGVGGSGSRPAGLPGNLVRNALLDGSTVIDPPPWPRADCRRALRRHRPACHRGRDPRRHHQRDPGHAALTHDALGRTRRRVIINARGSRRRLALTVLIVFAIVGVFVVRLVDIQVVRAADLTADAERAPDVTVTTYGVRGSIVDANGVVLADSVERFDITASPKNADLDTTWMTRDGERVEVPTTEAIQAIADLTGADAERDLPDARHRPRVELRVPGAHRHARRLQEGRALQIPWVYSELHPARTYPSGAIAGNLVGFIGTDGPLAGTELKQDECLGGDQRQVDLRVQRRRRAAPGQHDRAAGGRRTAAPST